MPVTVTFDLPSTIDNNDRTRIRLAFQRLGRETVGGTAYRYPPLASLANPAQEDWLNCVVPALMFLRCVVEKNNIRVSNLTIDASSSSGFRTGFGVTVLPSVGVSMQPILTTDDPVLSEQRLRDWMQDCARSSPP